MMIKEMGAMKKIKIALAAALATFLLPASLAFGVTTSPTTITGSTETTSSTGATATVSGTKKDASITDSWLHVEESSEVASNAPTDGSAYITFKVTEYNTTGPYTYTFDLGSEFANRYVTVYVQHETGDPLTEVISSRSDASGVVTITTERLSLYTIVIGDAITTTSTDTSSTSPQTGVDTVTVAAVTGAAVVAAAGVAVALRKKVSE